MVSPNSKDFLDIMVCTPTKKNLVVVYQKCVYFSILLSFEIYGRCVVECFLDEMKIITFL